MFFTLVDELSSNPKMRRLLDHNLVGDATGTIATTLWMLAGTTSRGSMTDGVVSRADTIRIMLNHEWAELGARKLVEVGLWHDAQTEQACETCMHHLASCATCRPLAAGEYRFHDWWQRRYDHGVQAKLNIAKKKELQDKKLRAQVWARDCLPGDPTVAPCRLCTVPTKQQDRKSDRSPEIDHVDPWLAVGAANLVVMCRSCNRKKGQRTPEEAGMVLQPPPARPHTTGRLSPADSPSPEVAGSPSSSSAYSHPSGSAGSRVTVSVPLQPRSGPLAGGEDRADPPAPVAGSRPSPPAGVAVPRPRPAVPSPDQSRPDPLIPSRIRGAELSSRAHAGEVGSGDGDGDGSGGGTGPGDGPGAGGGGGRRRRRRGRGGRKQKPISGAGPEEVKGRAGEVPPVDYQRVPGKEGSPFRNHHGPWVDRDDQSMCLEHGLDRPCWMCEEGR